MNVHKAKELILSLEALMASARPVPAAAQQQSGRGPEDPKTKAARKQSKRSRRRNRRK